LEQTNDLYPAVSVTSNCRFKIECSQVKHYFELFLFIFCASDRRGGSISQTMAEAVKATPDTLGPTRFHEPEAGKSWQDVTDLLRQCTSGLSGALRFIPWMWSTLEFHGMSAS
jgi:hypothetical protein